MTYYKDGDQFDGLLDFDIINLFQHSQIQWFGFNHSLNIKSKLYTATPSLHTHTLICLFLTCAAPPEFISIAAVELTKAHLCICTVFLFQ